MTLRSFMEKQPEYFPSGYISPEGDFHYADYLEHWDAANLLCRSYKYENKYNDPQRTLEEKGWIHITRSTLMGCLMIMNEKHWTEAQIESIRPLIENPPIPLEHGAHWLYGRYYPDIDIKSKEMELIY